MLCWLCCLQSILDKNGKTCEWVELAESQFEIYWNCNSRENWRWQQLHFMLYAVVIVVVCYRYEGDARVNWNSIELFLFYAIQYLNFINQRHRQWCWVFVAQNSARLLLEFVNKAACHFQHNEWMHTKNFQSQSHQALYKIFVYSVMKDVLCVDWKFATFLFALEARRVRKTWKKKFFNFP